MEQAIRDIICPNCRTPYKVQEYQRLIYFPQDEAAIISFYNNNFGIQSCPLCGEKCVMEFPAMILNIEKKELIAAYYTDESPDDVENIIQEYDLKIHWVESYPDVTKIIFEWVETETTGIFDLWNQWVSANDTKYLFQITRLQWRLLYEVTQGRSYYKFSPGGGINMDFYNDMVYNFLKFYTFYEMQYTLSPPLITDIPSRIPICILSNSILEKFAADCNKLITAEDVAYLPDKWKFEYVCATCYYLIGQGNPRQEEFNKLIWHYWLMCFRKEKKEFAIDFLLDRQSASATLSEDLFFSYIIDYMSVGTDDKSLGEKIEDIQFLLQKYGWEERFIIYLGLNSNLQENHVTKNLAQSYLKFLFDELAVQVKNKALDYVVSCTYVIMELHFMVEGPEKTLQYFYKLFNHYKNTEDSLTLLMIANGYINVLKRRKDFETILHLYSELLQDLIVDDPLHGPALILYMELATASTYMGDLTAAKAWHDKAEVVLNSNDLLPKDQVEAFRYAISLNNSHVYNHSGQLEKAIEELEVIHSKFPTLWTVANNLSNLYAETGAHRKSLQLLNRFLNNGKLNYYEKQVCTLNIIMTFNECGEFENAYKIFHNLYRNNQSTNFDATIFVYTVAVSLVDPYFQQHNILVNIDAEIKNYIQTLPQDLKQNRQLYKLGFCLVEKLLNQGKLDDVVDVMHLLDNFTAKVAEYWSGDWSGNAVLCQCYVLERNIDAANDCIKKFIYQFNQQNMVEDRAGTVMTGMMNKQRTIQSVLDLATSMIEYEMIGIEELLNLIDLKNGKEISYGMSDSAQDWRVHRYLHSLTGLFPETDFLIFFEANDTIQLMHLTTVEDEIECVRIPLFDADWFKSIKEDAIQAYRSCATAMLDVMDEKLSPLVSLLCEIGNDLNNSRRRAFKRVYIVAGQHMSNLPLHLITFPDGKSLIQKAPVYYVPNLAALVMIDPLTTRKESKLLIAGVTKSDDKREFETAMNESIQKIALMAEQSNIDVTMLTQTQVDLERVTSELSKVDEAVFICHGALAGDNDGHGICLSYQNELPPGFMPVREVPELKKHLLTWKELAKLEKTPEIFISLACSTGVVLVNDAGNNFGFEQSLFSRGTKIIISPLWDIDQESSLKWLVNFFGVRLANPQYEIGKQFQMASYYTMKQYPHHFYWAPFVIKGRNN